MSAENIENEMQEVIDRLEVNFSEVRAGRANPAILNKVTVDYYGTPTPINQIASIRRYVAGTETTELSYFAEIKIKSISAQPMRHI